MKMRKYGIKIIALFVGIVMGQGTVFADMTINEITFSNGLINVSGNWDSGEALTYEVYKNEVTTPDFSDITGFGEIPFSYDNKFDFTFGLNDTGTYKICLSDGYEIIFGEFDYASEEDRNEFIAGINLILENPETLSGYCAYRKGNYASYASS